MKEFLGDVPVRPGGLRLMTVGGTHYDGDLPQPGKGRGKG
jgi:hypothetical protein